MTYEQISEYMSAAFIYADVTDEEFAAMPVSHYMTFIDGVRYIGTDVAVEALAAKQIVAA
jgi:hypothetical protein